MSRPRCFSADGANDAQTPNTAKAATNERSFIIVSSGDDFLDGLAVIDLQPLAARHFESPGIEAELVQHRGVQVGDVMPALDSVKANRIGRAMSHAAFDAAAGQPD